ncbi:MAG: nitroreductase family protein [Desulfobacterales bacterium]|nr:MAG: nitroreductase family protein [Desulfobacterales bacterium]
MNLLSVYQEKCKRDGICIAECPTGIIEFKTKEAFPTIIDGGDEFCITCGHCVAVCPHGAMNHAVMSSEACPPVRNDLSLGPDQVEHFLRSRRSIRTYKKKPVDRKTLAKLIDIACFAPSGHNRQPVNWLMIYDSEEVYRLAGLVIDWMQNLIKDASPLAAAMHMDRVVAAWEAGTERICRGAPHIVVAHAPEDERTAQAACTIALAYVELAAPSFGLGACWAGYFNAAANFWPPMKEALSLPDGHVSFGAMMIGHPKYRYQRLPSRNEARIIWR